MFHAEIKSGYGEDICILVRPENYAHYLMFDCGEASGLTVKEVQKTRAVFISHTHIDHFANFDSLIRHQVGCMERIVVCGPVGLAAQVQARLRSYTWNLVKADAIEYEVRELHADGRISCHLLCPPAWEMQTLPDREASNLWSDAGMQVQAVILDHKTDVLAYQLIREGQWQMDVTASPYAPGAWIRELKAAREADDVERMLQIGAEQMPAGQLFHLLSLTGQETLGIIMDHAASPENHALIREHFRDFFKVFIECFYKSDEREKAEKNAHSYTRMSAQVMRETGVREAVPVHFSRMYTEDEIKGICEEFERVFHS